VAGDRRPAQPLIHGYNSVDFDILWQIVIDDLPPLITALEKALE
jgi:uncharacterized protein with HEPN domain